MKSGILLDTTNLSPEQSLRLQGLTKEYRRKQREERIWEYVPSKPSDTNAFGVPSNDQLGLYTSTSNFRLARGSNRSGKSESSIQDGVQFARGLHPVRSLHRKPPCLIRYCAPSLTKNIKILLDKLKQFCPRSELLGGSWTKAWSEKYKTLSWANGSEMEFLSFEQDVEKFAGKDLDACYSDEHGPLKYFRENMARLTDRNGFYMQTFTPDLGSATWEKRVFRDLVAQGFSFEEFVFTIYGNPFLDAEGVKTFEASLGTDEYIKKIKLMGEYAALAGMVYPDFRRDIHVIPEREIPSSWYRMFILDPHMKKAHGMLWVAITPDNDMICYRYANKFLVIDDLKAYIRTKSAGERISLWMGDEAMGGDGLNVFGERSVIMQLQSGEIAIPIVGTNQASDKSFEAGVHRLRSMMRPDPITKKPSFYIMSSYKGHSNEALVDEFMDYQFLADEKADEKTFRERVRKIDDEGPDCGRYAAMSMAVTDQQTVQSATGSKW